MTITHDTNTRFPATDTTGFDTTTGDRTFSHAGSASAKGAVVVVCCTGTTAVVTGVLYGGHAMTLTDTATDTVEAGRVDIYTLTQDASFPTGTQTVTLQGCTATQKWATCSTVTCSVENSTKVNNSGHINTTTGVDPSVAITNNGPVFMLAYGAVHGGAAAPTSYTATANYTIQYSADYGALSARSSRRTSEANPATVTYNFAFNTSDDYCITAVLLEEEPLPSAAARPILVMQPRSLNG